MPRLSRLAFGLAVAASVHAQNPCFDLNVGTNLNLSDDSTAQGLALGFTFTYAGVPYTDVCVCSNGYIWFGPTSTTGGDFTPTEAELLAQAPRLCPLWDDLNPSAGGDVYFHAVPASGPNPPHALVTWVGVFEYGTTNPVDMQVRFDQNGAITITHGPNPPIGGTTVANMILGASPGMGALSNPVTFATRPFLISQDNFAEVLPTGPMPYAGVSMVLAPTVPGYAVADLPCSPSTFPGPAQFGVFGTGCPLPPTVYELFPAATVDLSNLVFEFLPIGSGGYLMLQLPAPFFTGFSNNLGAGDDTTHAVTLPFPFPYDGGMINDIVVSSNGFLTLGTTNPGSGCCSGSVAALLAGPPRIAGHWGDLNPSTTGGVYADLDPVTGDFCITWDSVPEYSAGAPSTFQIALKPSGVFDLRFGTVVSATHTTLTGYSGGNNAPDPGGIDLSATQTHTIAGGGSPLQLGNLGASLPQLGGTLNLEVSAIPATSVLAVLVVGLLEANPPIDLGLFGASGCNAYVDFILGPTATLNALTGGLPTAAFALSFPTDPAFAGTMLTCQGIADDVNANQLGVRLSNGARLTVGL